MGQNRKQDGIRKYENIKTTASQKFWNTAKAVVGGKFIALNTYIEKKKATQPMTSASTLRTRK